MAGIDFPLTHFMQDVIKMQQGQLTRDQIRINWREGKYPGVNPDYAKWNMG